MLESVPQLSRRAFVRNGSLFLLGVATTDLRAAEERPRKVRVPQLFRGLAAGRI